MSLAETQELMRTMQELMALLGQVETKADSLIQKTPQLQQSGTTFRDAERLALRYLSLARRMGLPDQIEQATQIVTQLVVMIRMLQISLTMVNGGGIGALIGIAGIIGVVMTANDMTGYDSMRGY
jgi:hypothetical protein